MAWRSDTTAEKVGAGGGSRPHTPLRETDFESAASDIPPLRHVRIKISCLEPFGQPVRNEAGAFSDHPRYQGLSAKSGKLNPRITSDLPTNRPVTSRFGGWSARAISQS